MSGTPLHSDASGATNGPPTGTTNPGTTDDARSPRAPRGLTNGGPAGGTNGGYHGGLNGVVTSADQLLAATDSWGLVVDPVPEPSHTSQHRLYTASGDESEADGAIIEFEAVDEALAAASLDVTLPAEEWHFGLGFAEFVLGYNGQRRLSGEFSAPDGDTGNQTVKLSGLGALARLKDTSESVSYGGMAAWRALREFASEYVTPGTDGDIRVVVVPPEPVRGEREAMIPADAPLELEGTLLEILSELHGYAGMVWSVDYSERGPGVRVESFVPGSQLREARWETFDVDPQLDTGDYATDVIVEGATKPGLGEENAEDQLRFRGTASASDMEVAAITGGDREVYEPPPKDSLESDPACREFARSKLDELRGTYQISADLDVGPSVFGSLVPGHVYRVPELDSIAPGPLSPVALPLRSVTDSFAAGTAERTLSFGPADDDPVFGTLLARDDPPLTLRGLARLDGDAFDIGPGTERDAWSAGYPHEYPVETGAGYDSAYDQRYDQ